MMARRLAVCAMALAVCATAMATAAWVPQDGADGTFEIVISRVGPSVDGAHAAQSSGTANGICYVWEQAEAFSPGVTVATFGWNSEGIAVDAAGSWGYNSLYAQCSGDWGSIANSWTIGENAVMVYEVFNTNCTTHRNYTMIFEDQIEGDGSTNFGTNNAQNSLTAINDPAVTGWVANNTAMLTIAPQTTGFEVAALFDGYGVWKSTTGPITQTNQGIRIGDAALEGSTWVYRDAAWTGSSYYAVRVKWNGGTYPFCAPLYSYGMSNDASVGPEHWTSTATGPVGTSDTTAVTITYNPDCGCFGWTHLYYSVDDGMTWTYIGTEEDEWFEDGFRAWTVPCPGEYWWLATNDYPEDDNPPAPGTTPEAGPYTVTAVPLAYNLPVHAGWNFVSLPIDIPSLTLPAQLLDGDVIWDRVMWYDAADAPDHWKQYNSNWSSGLNDLGRVEVRAGFWLRVTDVGDGYMNLSGYDPGPLDIPLRAGWNMVGYPTTVERSVSDAFFGAAVDIVEGYDGAQTYRTKTLVAADVMRPGEGYWVHASADTVWHIDW